MGDDQMRFGIDSRLDVIADHAAVAPTSGHGAGDGIGQRYLTVRRIGQYPVHGLQMLDLLPDAAIALSEMRG